MRHNRPQTSVYLYKTLVMKTDSVTMPLPQGTTAVVTPDGCCKCIGPITNTTCQVISECLSLCPGENQCPPREVITSTDGCRCPARYTGIYDEKKSREIRCQLLLNADCKKTSATPTTRSTPAALGGTTNTRGVPSVSTTPRIATPTPVTTGACASQRLLLVSLLHLALIFP